MSQSESSSNWYVLVRNRSTGEVVKEMGPMSEGKADSVANGVNINLNHDDYIVVVQDRKD